MGRYSFGVVRDLTPENLPGFGSFNNNLAQNATFQYTHLISSTSVNVFWLGMSCLSMHRYSQDNFTTNYVAELGIEGVGFGGQGTWACSTQRFRGLSDHPKPAIYDHLKTGHMETHSGTLTDGVRRYSLSRYGQCLE